MKGSKEMAKITIMEILFTFIPMIFWFMFFVFVIKAVKKGKNGSEKVEHKITLQRMDDYYNTSASPNRYSTINSHYSQQTLQGTGVGNGTNAPYNGGHTHAYEHKVEPIGEATVHEIFEDRKEAYRERKQMMKADLPKTSYSKMEESGLNYTSNSYSDTTYNNYGTNGDVNSASGYNEESVTCKYCGAVNILPKSRTKEYNCYFCREVI
jgi:hypothetical protein